jgi:hypothetical protein
MNPHYPSLSIIYVDFTEQISNIRSYAHIALDLFRIDAPNVSSFKSLATVDTRSGEPILVPYILPSGLCTPSTVFLSKDLGWSGNCETEPR